MLSGPARVGLVVAAAGVLAAGFSFVTAKFDNVLEGKCTAFTGIAKDAQKMNYVREWVAKRTASKEFMELVVKYRAFEQFSPYTPKYIDLDWRYLGFDPRAAWIGFNINDAEEQGADPARILSISLNQGRAGVILKLNPTDDVVGKFGPPGNKSSVKPVGNDAFVYCDFEN